MPSDRALRHRLTRDSCAEVLFIAVLGPSVLSSDDIITRHPLVPEFQVIQVLPVAGGRLVHGFDLQRCVFVAIDNEAFINNPRDSASTTTTLSVSPYSTSSKSAEPTETANPGSSIAPKVLFIANSFEFTYLKAYDFTTAYTGPLFTQNFTYTTDGQIYKLACGQELVSASQITALLLIPGINLSKTYIIITGTGGEWGDMFLGSDLPANFSGQYFSAYAQDAPDKYPFTVGSEIYKLSEALVDRFYSIGSKIPYEDLSASGQALRATYEYAPARKPPFLARCDTVSAQVYWHGKVAGENVEYYTNVERLLALFLGAVHKKVDFTRVAMIKAFSNFDRPPPQLTAYQSRFLVGEAATEPGLRNAWASIVAVAEDVLKEWESFYHAGIVPNTYYGDLDGTLGGAPDFGEKAGAAPGSIQGAPP